MNNESVKLLEQIKDTISIPELLLIQATQLLTMTPHTKEYIETQKTLTKKLDVREAVKAICLQVLDEVKIKEDK